MSGPYCEQHARAHEHGRCDMCQLEAQCAAMNEALRAGVMGYDADLRASRGHGLPVALWDWVERALAPDAGKALLEAGELWRQGLEDHRALWLRAKQELRSARAQAFEECAKVVEALFKCGLHDLATCPSSCADYVRRHAATIRAKAKEGA